MNLSKIKEKYKEILEQNEPDSNDSDNEWQLAYSRMKNKRRKHILTESQCMNRSSISMQGHPQQQQWLGDEEKLLRVKEKLAQSLANLQKKDQEIEELKMDNVKHREQNKILQGQIRELKDSINGYENKLIEQKVQYSYIEKTMQDINKSIVSEKMDKELLQRQIEYYQSQIEMQKRQGSQREAKFEELRKEIKNVDKYKSINARLREDVGRLCQLLSETEKYKVFASKIEYKNYIGKSCKEHQCWISEDLVQDVETFLRKHHNGSLGKQFTNSLIKFVSKNMEATRQQTQKRARKYYNSKLKDKQRKQNHSMNIMQIREQELRKNALGNSIIKSRRHTNTLNDSKLFTESFLYNGLDKSHITHNSQNVNKNRDVCLEILSSFRKGVLELLQAKEIKRKKLTKLIDWVIDGVMAIFPRDRALGHDNFRLETEEIKITL